MDEKLLKEAHQYLPEPRQAKAFATEVFLHGLRDLNQATDSEVAKKIERLCKKVEVPRRLVVEYSDDLSKTVDSSPVAPEYAVYFTSLLLLLASEEKDLKYLNCALKLVDGYLNTPKFVLPQSVCECADSIVEKLLVNVRLYERS